MPGEWRLKEFLAERRGLQSAAEAARLITERTGHRFSLQAVYDLLNGPPKMLRVETLQIICDAFYCTLADFFTVLPAGTGRRGRARAAPPKGGAESGAQPDSQVGGAGGVDYPSLFPSARNRIPGSGERGGAAFRKG